MKDLQLDLRRMVKDFGGMTNTSRLLTANGWPTSRDAVDKWRRRQSLPVNTLCVLAQSQKNVDKGLIYTIT